MKKDEFRNWLLISRKIQHPNDYISKISTIEKFHGDIDEMYDKDKCAELSELFTYSKKDSEAKIPPRHSVPIQKYRDKDIYQTYLNTTQDYSARLNRYIDFRNNEKISLCIYPEADAVECFVEGATTTITINKYERNPLARQKCIDIHGCYCHICGMNFEDIYGEIGKDFIHVHHIVAISEINEEYTVNPETDLIPVCPNCHAMAHRKVNGVYVSLDELRKIFVK